MSVDYTRTTDGDAPQESESSMFAPIPVWDRGKKSRGARRAMFQDTPATDEAVVTGAAVGGATGALAADEPMTREATRETAMSPNGDDAPVMATRTTTVRRRGSVAPAAVAVGLVALAALAAAGWYATRPADKSLTPGGSTVATSTTTSLAANTAPAGGANLAATPPTADSATAAGAPTTSTTTTRHRVITTARAEAPAVTRSRVVASPERSVRARSASADGVNTGAVAPVGPASSSVGAVPSTPSTAMPPPAATAPPINNTPAPTASPAPAPATTTPDVTPPPSSSTATTTPTTPPPQ